VRLSRQGPFTQIEMDGRVDQLLVALALTRALFSSSVERYDEMRDRAIALETAIAILAPDKESAIHDEAERLDREHYARDRRDYYESLWEGGPPSLAALTMPG
jgi:ribosome assembly protein YihI (activator of Der GTPase)